MTTAAPMFRRYSCRELATSQKRRAVAFRAAFAYSDVEEKYFRSRQDQSESIILQTTNDHHQHMKYKNSLIACSCFAILAICLSLTPAAARAKASPSPDASVSPAATAKASPATSGKMRATPFKGIIATVDDKAKTFTIAGKENSRSLKITDKTVITKAGEPATMKDVVANEEVRGAYYKAADGSMEAKIVKLGPLTEAEKAEREARRAKREERKAATSPAASASPSVSPST